VRLKLDENIGRRGLELLRAGGHDVMTVRDQRLHGVSDDVLFDVCVAERRALVTLDRDFGQILRFPPEESAGIVMLDLRLLGDRSSDLGPSQGLPRSDEDDSGGRHFMDRRAGSRVHSHAP
jgi:Domain of unknown function (DUF5615)